MSSEEQMELKDNEIGGIAVDMNQFSFIVYAVMREMKPLYAELAANDDLWHGKSALNVVYREASEPWHRFQLNRYPDGTGGWNLSLAVFEGGEDGSAEDAENALKSLALQMDFKVGMLYKAKTG